jgi:surface polysaccharide O-acyltransferase-like enzyme
VLILGRIGSEGIEGMESDNAVSSADEDAPKRKSAANGPTRFVEIDSLKAAGIIAVILIHSLRAPWDPRVSSTEVWLGIVTRFAVPGFLFCSGFLYATTKRIRTQMVLRRLRRVLVPYLICSVAAQIWWFATGQGHAFDAIVEEILLGSSFGPFYYVFVHFFLVLFAPLFALLPGSALAGLTALMLVGQGWLETRTGFLMPIFWHIRNPLLWWGYFLLGWMVRLHYDNVRRWIAPRRGLLITAMALAVLTCTWFASAEIGSEWLSRAKWLNIHSTLALIFVATCGRRSAPAPLAILADATFAIYLLHLFFVYAAERLVQPTINEFDILVIAGYWSAGLFGALGVISLARRLLGPRSRDVIGA